MDNLEKLSNADILTCNADELVDLRSVTVSREKSISERAKNYIVQVRNPYLFRVGSTVVKVEFDNGKDFTDILTDMISAG